MACRHLPFSQPDPFVSKVLPKLAVAAWQWVSLKRRALVTSSNCRPTCSALAIHTQVVDGTDALHAPVRQQAQLQVFDPGGLHRKGLQASAGKGSGTARIRLQRRQTDSVRIS